MHHPTDRRTHTTAFVTPVVEHWLEREIAQLVHTMEDRSDDPSHHERTLLPRSYISLQFITVSVNQINVLCVSVLSHVWNMFGATCSSVVRVFAHGRRINPSWWTHWAISSSSQCSMTGVTKAVICTMWDGAYKRVTVLVYRCSHTGKIRRKFTL